MNGRKLDAIYVDEAKDLKGIYQNSISKKCKTVAQRRYYMNRVLKGMGVHVNTNTREIKLPYKSFNQIPVGLRFYIGQCIKMQYNVQYELF